MSAHALAASEFDAAGPSLRRFGSGRQFWFRGSGSNSCSRLAFLLEHEAGIRRADAELGGGVALAIECAGGLAGRSVLVCLRQGGHALRQGQDEDQHEGRALNAPLK